MHCYRQLFTTFDNWESKNHDLIFYKFTSQYRILRKNAFVRLPISLNYLSNI